MAQWLDAHVTSRTDWNDHLFSLTFTCPGFPQFKAGQFTKVGIPENDAVISRPYSLVNAPDAVGLEILAVPVPNGHLSPRLHELKVDDPVRIMAPATGFLVLDEIPQCTDLWLVATGTGVGPFLSILQDSEIWQRFEKVVLVYGTRHCNDLAYTKLIEQWQQQHSNQFRFVPVVSREDPPSGLRGRIPPLFQEQIIQRHINLDITPEDSHVMLCGNPQMITDAIETLNALGLQKHLRRKPGHISMERYW